MKIVEIGCLRGPGVWSVRKPRLVVMKLDLEDLEYLPTNKIDGFYERIKLAMPSLHGHFCSEGHPGGFFERVKDGTWMGHVIEHIALEMQTLAGMDCGYGRTRSTHTTGVYNVVFEYKEERAGLRAAELAVDMAEALRNGKPFDLRKAVEELKTIYENDRLGPSAQAVVSACQERNIPVMRLNDQGYVQLGYGSKQKRIEATVTSQTSSIAVELAGDKDRTKQHLASAGVPVPKGVVVSNEKDFADAVAVLGFPVVIKPLDGNQGKGVTTNIGDMDTALEAYSWARVYSEEVILEQHVEGHDYRLLVVGYKLSAAARRTPARVIGDGISTIRELIHQINLDPRRGEGHQNILTRIVVDEAMVSYLAAQGLTLDAVIESDREIMLKNAANLSMGGTSEDVTDMLHPELIALAERTAKIIGLDVCGIDIIARQISQPLRESGAMVIEVNASPGLRMHTQPTAGKARDVGVDIARMLFPGDQNGRIPIIAITGTNGKTTTTRLTAHLMKHTGASVGYTTTDGIYINDMAVEEGDCTGPASARMVLNDPTVDVAVLESARGGILRSGLAFDSCDTAIITNVAADHLGLKEIATLEEMTAVKAVVAETVRADGYAILNADNDPSYSIRERVRCKVALFSLNPDSERVTSHLRAGGLCGVFQDGMIVISNGFTKMVIEDVRNIPASFGGKCPFMIENILGAVLAAYVQGASPEQLRAGLVSFQVNADSTPGRLNHFQFRDFGFLVDYAHNPHGMTALGKYLDTLPATSKVGIITGVGDRRDDDLRELGEAAAGIFDEIIIRADEDLRGRKLQEIVRLVRSGIRKINPFCKIEVIPDEMKAIDFAIRKSRPGQLIVLTTEKIRRAVSLVTEFRKLEEQYGSFRQRAFVDNHA